MKRLKIILVICLLVLSTQVVFAETAPVKPKAVQMKPAEGFALANYEDLSFTAASFDQTIGENDQMIDQYIEIFHCEAYKAVYKNDFELQKLRQKIRKEVAEKKDPFHRFYEILIPVRFDRYDFQGQYFPLDQKSKMVAVRAIMVFSGDWKNRGNCVNRFGQIYFPMNYQVVLTKPITIDRIRISTIDAEALLNRGKKVATRTAYLRIRFRILDKLGYGGPERASEARFSALQGAIEAIDFFEDPEATKLISSGQ